MNLNFRKCNKNFYKKSSPRKLILIMRVVFSLDYMRMNIELELIPFQTIVEGKRIEFGRFKSITCKL